MEKLSLFVKAFCCAALLATTYGSKDCVKTSIQESLKNYATGLADFTTDFLYEVHVTNKGKSSVMSPFSVQNGLAPLALFSRNASHDQLMYSFNLKHRYELQKVFASILNDIKKQKEVTIAVNSKVYVSSQYPLSTKFKCVTKKSFDSDPENINFSKPSKAAKKVNRWVAKATDNMITEIVKPDMFNELTRLLLVNTILFKGKFISPFKPANTKSKPFYTSSTKAPTQVETMYQQNIFPYGESKKLDAKILRLPIQGGNFSFYVLLPNKVDGLNRMLVKMQDINRFNRVVNRMKPKTVQVSLPKFKSETSLDLKQILSGMRITNIFNPKKASLYGILQNNDILSVTSAVQKAFIDVHESGISAAAATAITVGVTSAHQPNGQPEVFIADHPFAYTLAFNNLPLFTGIYSC